MQKFFFVCTIILLINLSNTTIAYVASLLAIIMVCSIIYEILKGSEIEQDVNGVYKELLKRVNSIFPKSGSIIRLIILYFGVVNVVGILGSISNAASHNNPAEAIHQFTYFMLYVFLFHLTKDVLLPRRKEV